VRAEGARRDAAKQRGRKEQEEGKEKERKSPLSMMFLHVYWISGSRAGEGTRARSLARVHVRSRTSEFACRACVRVPSVGS